MARIAAIDQGTTSTRVLVIDGDDDFAIKCVIQHRQHFPNPGWVEHDPRELLANVRNCIAQAGIVDAIGLANQGESCLAWDRFTLEPLSPVIVWQDNRTAQRVAALKSEGFEALTRARAGLPLDAYFSASKLAWLLDNVGGVKQAHAAGRLCLGTTDAFFLHSLTGRFVTDVTTASRTSLMNLATGQWDADLCALFGVPMECLPEIRPTVSSFGSIGDIAVTASVVDQQAALYGHGCRASGDSKITFGTGAFALTVTGEAMVAAEAAQGLLPTVAWDLGQGRTYALDGGIYDAGSAVEWALKAGIAHDLSDFSAFAAPAAIDRGLVFVPAFSGLACPHWDRSASPLILGLAPDMTRVDICQALLEGIVLLTGEVMSALSAAAPLGPRISIDGGLSRSPYFAQFLATTLGRDIVTSQFDEMTALGTATFAAIGLGETLRINPAASTARLFSPDAANTDHAHIFGQAVGRSRGWRY